MSSLSVVVPATDSPPTLACCLTAIVAADEAPDDLVVVDRPAHLSASAARNAGARGATGDIVVFIDADVEVHPDVFTRIRAAFAERPEVSAVYGSYDDAPRARGLISSFRNLLHHHVHQGAGGPAETFWTGLGAIRHNRLLDVGGFDEERFPYPSIEDIELGERLRAAGDDILLDPTIQGTHLKVWTLRSMLWTDFARRGVPWVALQVRDRRMSAALNCGWRHRLSAVACALGATSGVLGLPVLVLGALVSLVCLNHGFYSLLVRRQGPVRAALGVALHILHHLVSVAAVPAGVAVGLWSSRRLPRPVRRSGPAGATPSASASAR